MSISVAVTTRVNVVETLSGPFVSPQNPTVAFDGLSTSETLTSTSAVPVSDHADYELTLTAGAGTIDLTSLPGKTPEETITGLGKKVQLLILRNKSTNANKITVAKGASNGYGLCASGDTWSQTFSPGQKHTYELDEAAPDVGTGARILDVTGTLAQVLQVRVVFG